MSKPNKQKYSNNYKKVSANQPKPASVKVAPPPKPVDFSTPITLTFNATDTLFFRESRPMESMGELQSVFPPPMRTLAGAIRTLIGETNGVNWQDYERNPQNPVRQIIGYSDDLGALRFEGAWLACGGERLYPAPLHLLKKDDKLHRLELDHNGIWCDLGKKVRLPKLPDDDEAKGSKPLENTWLTRAGFESVLNGNKPTIDQLKTAKDLFERESRLGIARDNATRSVQEGMLYQTQHIRPHADLSIEVDVTGLPDTMPQNAIIRVGGEGRSASISVKQANNALPKGKAGKGKADTGIALYLLTPLNMPQGTYLGFTCEERDTHTVWTGTLNGIALELHGAVTGKALREGGWDMANRQPRAVTSLIPAGSVFFCKIINGDTAAAINALHNQHIGTLTAYGYGHLAVGVWNDQ